MLVGLVAAGAVLLVGAVTVRRGRPGRLLLPVVAFLAAILVVAEVCAAEGVFAAVGSLVGRAGRGSPRRMLLLTFVAAPVTTAALSLDATVVLLTPVVAAPRRPAAVSPRPMVHACARLANSASLLLPVSNLTNLLALPSLPDAVVRRLRRAHGAGRGWRCSRWSTSVTGCSSRATSRLPCDTGPAASRRPARRTPRAGGADAGRRSPPCRRSGSSPPGWRPWPRSLLAGYALSAPADRARTVRPGHAPAVRGVRALPGRRGGRPDRHVPRRPGRRRWSRTATAWARCWWSRCWRRCWPTW